MTVKRIFWLGAHKVLKQTELRQLRDLGFEVFNPAYITPVYDQSADLRIDVDQPTTLPQDVFHELLACDFFYVRFNPRIFELLNEYFDVVMVTINANWLAALLEGYNGQVIFRIYGQHFSLSEEIIRIKLWEKLVTRGNFCVVPFNSESVEREHNWFLDLCRAFVPYQIPDDVFERSGEWGKREHRFEIATSIPNIQNPYFAAAYSRFSSMYPQRLFRIYGPQRGAPADARIVGALERGALLDRFEIASGYLYNYTDDVCYLPPVEMMELGGPVIYAAGSLLSRLYKTKKTPGLILDRADAETKLHRLLTGDAVFTAEVVAAQEDVRQRYDRAVVKPIFDDAFRMLLGGQQASQPRLGSSGPYICTGTAASATATRPTIAILLHADGLFEHQKGKAYAFQGIPRVVDVIVDVLSEFSNFDIEITCTDGSLPAVVDFFSSVIGTRRARLRPLRCGGDVPDVEGYRQRVLAIEGINRDASIVGVIIPHYYLFPEALLLTAPTILYLPDYFPHLMPGTIFDKSAEKDRENKEVGLALAKRASAILTNSRFTANYLPDAGFVAPGEGNKIVVAPLPLLGAGRTEELSWQDAWTLRHKIAGRRVIFYPTANRPNKQLAFMLQLFALIRMEHPDLLLVLTCNLGAVPAVARAADRFELNENLITMPSIDESSLRWLYENAAVLCLTSTSEGNFPPQVLEALVYGTPVVATRLPTITELLGDRADDLLLCSPLDLGDFRLKLSQALTDRNTVLGKQAEVLERLRRTNSREQFYRKLEEIVSPLSARKQAA